MKPTLSKLTKDLDRVFSEYIRRRSADFKGNVQCVCCGRSYPWKEMQAGHYVKRSARSLRWEEKNVFPCCVGCNVFQNGNYPAFTEYLLNSYGADWLRELIREGREIKKWTIKDLQEKIEKYKNLIKSL